ncbi:hypothetical protein ACVWWQ_002370 [Rhodanobacter sp. TND4EL1]
MRDLMSSQDLLSGAVALGALLALLFFVRLRTRRVIPSRDAGELQAFLVGCVSELRQVLERSDLDATSLGRETNAILQKMQSRNSDGALDAFIQDNREATKQIIARRRAA